MQHRPVHAKGMPPCAASKEPCECITNLQAGELQLWSVDQDQAAAAADAEAPPGGAAPPLSVLSLADSCDPAAAAAVDAAAHKGGGSGGDAITCAAPLRREPYVLLGCASGAVRVAMVANASGCGVVGARPARGLRLMPYRSGSMIQPRC